MSAVDITFLSGLIIASRKFIRTELIHTRRAVKSW